MKNNDRNIDSAVMAFLSTSRAENDLSNALRSATGAFEELQKQINLSNRLLTETRALEEFRNYLVHANDFKAMQHALASINDVATQLNAIADVDSKIYSTIQSATDLISSNNLQDQIASTLSASDSLLQHLALSSAQDLWKINSEIIPDALSAMDKGIALPDSTTELIVSASLSGTTSKEDLKKFLLATSERFPNKDELFGGARSLRESMLRVENRHAETIDIVGTGGDGHSTFNISTAAAIVTAASGVKVAKHGNRSASSQSGAADVLETLGVNLRLTPTKASDTLDDIGLTFLFAQSFHRAMLNVAEARKEIGKRTIFNLLGPLSNPASIKKTLLGVYDKKLLRPMGEALKSLGITSAWLVHGNDGMDEVTTTGRTQILKLEDGQFSELEIQPQDFGLKQVQLSDLRGGDVLDNAKAIKRLLKGEEGAFRDIVAFNAGVALAMTSKANDIKTGIDVAKDAIDSGNADRLFSNFVSYSNSP